MAERKSWELTPEQKESLEKRNPMQELYEYNKYVMQQEEEFVKVMNFVNSIINDLIEDREISEFAEIRARIKSQKSVLANDPVKAVDDVFGMEIITPTEQEYKRVIEELKEWMTVQKEKHHNKKNGYKATHLAMTFKKEHIKVLGIEEDKYEEIPMIEFQFKTIETMIRSSRGEAIHSKYKGESLEEIQRKYDAGEYREGSNGVFELPSMWKSHRGKMILLDTEETLQTMHPFLKTKKRQKGEQR